MSSNYKKLITDIGRDSNLDSNLKIYFDSLSSEYERYVAVKVSMNYFTMKEMLSEQETKDSDAYKYFDELTKILKNNILNQEAFDSSVYEIMDELRSKLEYKMKILTAYTDGFELYEHALNRLEAKIKNTIEEVDTDSLSSRLFQFVFSENDTVVINSKLQMILAQLPIRMTKNRFYDVITNTLSIYKGGETTSVDTFCEMLKAAVLIDLPDGFATEYPSLYEVYKNLSEASYKEMTEECFDKLTNQIADGATLINSEVTSYMLLQEVINDVYSLLLTNASYTDNKENDGFKAACNILNACVENDDLEKVISSVEDDFMSLEGVQEETYESIAILESMLEDIRLNKAEALDANDLLGVANNMAKVAKLLSTSLFMTLDEIATGEICTADSDYIMKLRDDMTDSLSKHFEGKDRIIVRSMMSKLLSSMPIFMNSQQEISDYFNYVLTNSVDASEMTAVNNLLEELMMDV